ncbi:hypothetical protein AA0482_1456 [Acetobacter cibinongensis NRIC 0482]|nr:hypothetical protein AA0482_1456 [Acetobacter cibinongensis NRIC 0482]
MRLCGGNVQMVTQVRWAGACSVRVTFRANGRVCRQSMVAAPVFQSSGGTFRYKQSVVQLVHKSCKHTPVRQRISP